MERKEIYPPTNQNKNKKEMSKIKIFLNNFLILIISTIFTNGLMLLSRIIIIRELSKENWGIISYIWNTSIVFGTILLFGRGQESLITLPQLNKKEKKAKSTEYIQYSIILYLIFIILFVIFLFMQNVNNTFIIVCSLNIGILYTIFYIPIFISIGYQEYRPILIFNLIVYFLLNSFLFTLSITNNLTLILAILSFIGSFFIGSLFSIFYISKKTSINLLDIFTLNKKSIVGLKTWTKERFLLFLSDILNISYSFITQTIMMLFSLTFEDIGIVSVAFTFASLLLLIPQKIIQAIGPKIVEEYNIEKKKIGNVNFEYRDSYLLGLKATLFFLGLAIILIAPISFDFISVIFGADYASSLKPFLMIYFLAIYLRSFNFVNYVTVRNTGRVNMFVIIQILSYISQIVFLSINIFLFGRNGVFIGFLVSEIFNSIFIIFLLNKGVKIISIKTYLKTHIVSILPIAIIVLLFILPSLTENIWKLLVTVFVSSIVFILISIYNNIFSVKLLKNLIQGARRNKGN
ncbi:MAG: hypothetical protein ACTSPQ_06780 [Candidatus Helarchaeota archaeon]